MARRTYVLTGGGTGGHVTPALAIANRIREREPEASFLWIGTKNGKEAEIVPKYGIEFATVPAHRFLFERPWHALRFLWRLTLGTIKSAFILLKRRPIAVIGTGGYVAAPVVFANIALRRIGLSKARTIIHEQNTTPGKLNGAVGRLADVVLVAFAATRTRFPRAVYVGYPVREEIRPRDQGEAKDRLGIPRDTQVVFAFGGSMGARTINRAVIEALPYFKTRSNLRIIHGTGKRLTAYDPAADIQRKLTEVGLTSSDLDGWYESHEFIEQIHVYYAAADIVVARGGAGTVAELCAAGRPSIIIPKSNLAGDHQVMNALELVNAGASTIVYENVRGANGSTEEYVSGRVLADRIVSLLDRPQALADMADAARSLATPEAVPVTVDIIMRVLNSEQIDYENTGLAVPQSSTARLSTFAWLSGETLRSRTEALVAELRSSLDVPVGRPREVEEVLVAHMRNDEVFRYLRYRAIGMLASPSWRMRNAGVKMAGLLRIREELPILLKFLTDRTPASRLRRLLGGDFFQNGFIRRNTVDAITLIGIWNEDVREALITALSDPYFEVRSHAAHAVVSMSDLIVSDERLEQSLVRNTRDHSFEVVTESAYALGCIGVTGATVERLYELLMHDNWKVREATLRSIDRLLDRCPDCVDLDRLHAYLDEMMIVSTGFVPTFALKSRVHNLGVRMNPHRFSTQAKENR